MKKWAFIAIAAVLFLTASTLVLAGDGAGVVTKPAPDSVDKPVHHAKPKAAQPIDHSGKRQKGVASYYGKKFNHKKTASGTLLDPNQKTAASKTLPIGTKAEVTNTENGKKTEVVVTDRGPYVKDRIIDVTPKVAEELEMKKDGVTKVEVKPIEVPATKEQEKAAVEHPPQ